LIHLIPVAYIQNTAERNKLPNYFKCSVNLSVSLLILVETSDLSGLSVE